MTREILLRNTGAVVLVDDEDFDLVSQFRWHENRGRAQRAEPGPNGRLRCVLMHRFILAAPKGVEVDHRDHNGLNNTRANLRLCNRNQNQMNARSRIGASGFRGVEATPFGTFHARIEAFGRRTELGTFADPEKAARAYDRAAIVIHGEFAILNFPAERAAA